MSLLRCLFIIFTLSPIVSVFSQSPLVSTDSDPDAFIQNCVNVLNGDYCEAATDLMIEGPNPLILQRFYSTHDSVSGFERGGWRIFPERFLVVGKDPLSEVFFAFAGERSGAILPYKSMAKKREGLFFVDAAKALGMVNTYAKEINGRINHRNNKLDCKGETCELTLGDGTKRIYQKIETLPSLILGEENTPLMADQVAEPIYYILTQEVLPSGNQLVFSYDEARHLIAVEMQSSFSKVLSWIHFSYLFQEETAEVTIEASDARNLVYTFSLENSSWQLLSVSGSHCIPVSYSYTNGFLTKKSLPEGRFVEVDYQEGKVSALKGPNALSGQTEAVYTFVYGKDFTDVFDAADIKTRYKYDSRFQLTAIENYDGKGILYRKEEKFWGKITNEFGRILAKTIADGKGQIHSYRAFKYDLRGNVIQESLYGNLTGKKQADLEVVDGKLLNADEQECNLKTYEYSTNGYNLLTKMGDCKGNQTVYTYKPNTNLLVKKFIYDKGIIKKRTFRTYNQDGVCIKTIEDDEDSENESDVVRVKERHIKEITPIDTLPGVGLPLVIEEKAHDIQSRKSVLVKKHVNIYDDQGNLLSSATYDANGEYAFIEKRTYTNTGNIASQTDGVGREELFTYDELGNCISHIIPHEGKTTTTQYDFHNMPILITETSFDDTFTLYNHYDPLGRKIASTDRYGNVTRYTYDSFHRLTQVVHPGVFDEIGQINYPTFTFTYDIFGNVLTTEDPEGYITKKTYTLRGDPAKITYPDGSLELFKYDPEGSLHRSLTRDQIITIYEYDYLGRCIYEESLAKGDTSSAGFIRGKSRKYNGFRCTYEKDDAHIKQYYFDPAGKTTAVLEYDYSKGEQDLESRKTELVYDSLGRVQKRKTWFAFGPKDYSLESYAYDLAGNILEKRLEDADQNLLLQRFYIYDLQDRCIEEYCYEDGKKTILVKTAYNAQGEPIAHTDALGNETQVILDNHNSLKKTLVNPNGVQTIMEYDPLGRMISLAKKDTLGTLLSFQKYFYDLLGNKICEIHDQIVEGKIVDQQVHRWTYGPMGRLEEEIKAANSPLAQKISYEYNFLGKLTHKNLPLGSIQYTYNKNGDLHKLEAQGKDDQKISNSYSYDRSGNITSAYSLYGKSVLRTYNVFQQVTQETIKDGEGTYTQQYKYDRKGRLKEIVLPDQTKIFYAYDAAFGRAVNRLSAKGEILYTHHYDSYDLQGKLLSETHIGNAGEHAYSYNLNGQKISSDCCFLNEEYIRDDLGRITQVKEKEEYTYNDLSQLTSEKKNTYSYDSVDNRIQINNETLVYNGLNQLTHAKGEYSYDPQGNLLKKILDGEETQLQSNILSQLISLEKGEAAHTFSYDPFGRLLVEKQFSTKGSIKKCLSTTRFLYLGYQEIGTLSQKGNIETLKIPGINQTSVAFEIQQLLYVPFHDGFGNVTSIVDPFDGSLVEKYEYTAFGEETILNDSGEEVSPFGNPWRFSEKRVHEKTGLVLFGFRFYDPSIGRWISQDPSGFIDGPNLYAYVRNNPLNHFDRFGLETESDHVPFVEYFFNEVEPHCFCEKHRTCKRGGDIGKTARSFPKITYDDEFEKLHKNYEGSKCYDLDGKLDLPNNMGIGFVNGVWNTFKDSKENAEYVSDLAGGYNVHAVFNATHGDGVDLKECVLGLNYIATEPVRQLHAMWNSFFEKSSSDANFLMICHSQGAIHVRNALLDYPPEFRERILVVAIAPAAYIYQETCAKVIHYRAEPWRDFIPRFDREGFKREKDSVVTLSSHKDAPYFDHKFMSPTYRERLWQHITKYIQSQGKTL